jgi:hypothetical protein
LFLIHSGWIRRVRGVPIYKEVTEGTGAAASELVPEDFLGAGNCLGLEALGGQSAWGYSAALMARSEVLEIPLAELRANPELCDRVATTFADFSLADDDTSLSERSDKTSLAAGRKRDRDRDRRRGQPPGHGHGPLRALRQLFARVSQGSWAITTLAPRYSYRTAGAAQ